MLRESAVYWLKYRDALGVLRREASGTEKEHEARRLLKRREGASVEGRVVIPQADRVTLEQLADTLRTDYETNGRPTVWRLRFSVRHLLAPDSPLAHRRAIEITGTDIAAYKAWRQAQRVKTRPPANATINRELSALTRMFTLAVEQGRLQHVPHISKLRESRPREGFFERDQFEAVRARLPEAVRGVVTFAYCTGWRVPSEVLTLTWPQVDFRAGTVRLETGTTKNGEGRVVMLTPELRACLEAQHAATRDAERTTGQIIPWVFHRGGRRIKNFKRPWRRACREAGLAGRIPHDFRRTAVRNLERAGVPRSVAMKMVGHKTEAIYRRYTIVDEGMLRDGRDRLAAFQASEQAAVGKVLGKVVPFEAPGRAINV